MSIPQCGPIDQGRSMDGFRRRLGLAAALCVLPALAAAGNGIDHITLRHEPNLTSVAVQAIVSGDDDTTAVLRIFQKWHENAAYDTGMDGAPPGDAHLRGSHPVDD